ncbi:hypothetical protein GCM10007907_09510 [Chitinimonas prasina]|uniref:diguanylate cyclase n=1 Tax=Chitinimonas prasina TaxID=1434937 RepID=A0ABQ5YC76_9NEIS|nr:diguanylate cyclase [Chitinimonas prasina]GLR12161.1 hypothetical protein GCM10007907_09510 [Chitinimonas prasina]
MINDLKMLIELRGARPKILVADDQPINIRAIHEIFKSECDIFMATSGEQALSLASSHRPDLIILDVMMPEMDGHEVCRRLKQDVVTKEIPVIFLTAQHTPEDEVLGFQLGAVDFIHKPIDSFVIQARVETHLALKLQTEYLRKIALTDGLTGIANRRQFDVTLVQDWLQCTREANPLSIVIVDVDHFKKFNDTYGHLLGDKCLRDVAHAIRAALRRPYDLATRYGGEEFACLLPNTDFDGAMHIAELIRQAVAALEIAHQQSETSPVVTVSLGVATCIPTSAYESAKLLAAADAQLYEAKQSGRNQARGKYLVE